MKRRILPMIMAVIMILSIIQVPAWAATGDDPAGEDGNPGQVSEQPVEESAEPSAPVEEEEPASNETNSLPNGETEEEPAPEESADNYVAEVNGQGFPTLQDAINEAEDGQTVKLLDNITLQTSEKLTISSEKDIVLDLNGKTLTESQPILVKGVLTVQDSTVTVEPVVGSDYKNVTYSAGKIYNTFNSRETSAVVIEVRDGGTLVHDSGILESYKNYTVAIYGQTSAVDWETPIHSTATINGGYQVGPEGGPAVFGNGAVLNVNDGVIVGNDNSAVAGNGSNNYGGYIINVNGGTLIGHIVSDGYVSCGIYHPNDGELNVSNGTIVSTNGAGIVARAGTTNITGGKIIAMGDEGLTGKVGDSRVVVSTSGVVLDLAAKYPGAEVVEGKATNAKVNISDNADISGTASAVNVVETYDSNTVKEDDNVIITGGTFSSDINTEYLADTVKVTDDGGTFTVEPLGPTDEASVAQVGSTYYKSLSAAIAEAKDGDTVTLLKDTELTSIGINKGITLDLGGNTLKLVAGSTSSVGLFFSSGSSKITNGTIQDERVVVSEGSNTAGYHMVVVDGAGTSLETSNVTMITNRPAISTNQYTYIIHLQNGSSGTLNSGTVLQDQMVGEQTYETYGAVGVNVLGTNGGATTSLTVNEGVKINTYGFAICGNGTMHGTSITINGGDITSEASTAIYHPQDGEITINDGSTITGENAGIEIRSGKLTVNGGTIQAKAEEFSCDPNGNGTTTAGAAIAIAQHTTKKDIAVAINGGTFIGVKALNESNPQENDPTPQVELSVRNGDFQGEITTADVNNFVSGGTFSSEVEDGYCAPGFEPATTSDGRHTVAVADDMTVKIVDANGNDVAAYETLDAALTHVTPGQTIALLANVEYNGKVSIPEGVTLDGNGNAITATAEITSGAFIEVMTDNVTIKDLVVNTNGKAKHGIQFYQTKGGELSGVTVNGGSYTSVIVNGSTDIRIENCTLNPGSGAYANIEYAMGSGVTTVPSVTVSNPKYDSGKPLVYVDSATIKAITNEANPSDKDIADALEQVNKNVTISGMEMVWVNGSFVARPIPTPVDPGDDDDNDNNNSGSTSVRRYNIEADAGRGGDISPDGRVRVRRGENQTFRITADDGWEIADVEVDGESVGAVERYTFENVRTDHTISATFRQIDAEPETPTLPFTDVAEGDWYYDAVAYCWENGIMDGTSGTTFAPNLLLNRAMMAQVLYNLADGTASTVAGFPDVAASAWYADAVNWAAANGYVTGYDNGSYGPEDSLTREQLAVILYRYAGSPEPTGTLDGFVDTASASDYAVDALRWAVGEGLLTGKDGGRLDPAGTASRAELAQILARFAQR